MLKPKLRKKFFLTWNKKKLYFLKKNLRRNFYKKYDFFKLKINFFFYPLFNYLWDHYEKRIDILSFRLNYINNIYQARFLIKNKSFFNCNNKIIKTFSKVIKFYSFIFTKYIPFEKKFFPKPLYLKIRYFLYKKKKASKKKLNFFPSHLLNYPKYKLSFFLPSFSKNTLSKLNQKKIRLTNIFSLQKKFKKKKKLKNKKSTILFFKSSFFLSKLIIIIFLLKNINYIINLIKKTNSFNNIKKKIITNFLFFFLYYYFFKFKVFLNKFFFFFTFNFFFPKLNNNNLEKITFLITLLRFNLFNSLSIQYGLSSNFNFLFNTKLIIETYTSNKKKKFKYTNPLYFKNFKTLPSKLFFKK